MSIRVGEVIAVTGVKIILKIDEDSGKETLYFDGAKYKGLSIREYVSVQRGFRDIVCIVEGEYLDESRIEGSREGKFGYVRKVEVRPIGYFENTVFREGIKFMPMIKDPAFLLPEERISTIYGKATDAGFVIGRMLKEDIPVSLPWKVLFNTHIGIFGNTGSGKSNTLAKLYTVLFDKKAASLKGKSRFVILDFNGEYTGAQLIGQKLKTTLKLATSGNSDRFRLSEAEFWNVETQSILFQATPNTQRPFLTRVVEGRNKFAHSPESLPNYIKSTFKLTFSAASQKRETLDLLRNVAQVLEDEGLLEALAAISWHGQQAKFYRPNDATYFDATGVAYQQALAHVVAEIDVAELDPFDQLIVRANLQLARDLIHGYVQFEHIQPLLKRVEASLTSLRKVMEVGNEAVAQKLLTVISLRRCNSEMKKVLPLLIAKHYYNEHKSTVANPPDKTVHLIIDEAHNILSQTSVREHESWKDYRLELFEEIIKEGRKFGVFVTISSQRPADISPTVISQLHNFFIHRLVNDRDLFLIDNTITTLDRLSRGLIPTLAKGCCVVTGSSFDLPMLLQMDVLEKSKQPDSEDVNLGLLWA